MKNWLKQFSSEDWIIVFAGAVILALACIFPEWMPVMPKTLDSLSDWLSAGYMFLFVLVLTIVTSAVLGRPLKWIFPSLLVIFALTMCAQLIANIPAVKEYGFELLDDRRQCLIEQIRTAVIEYVRYDDSARKTNLSDYLTRKCRHDYSALSRLFSEANGTSIERYYILQRVERVKELLIYDELSVSEIADRMGYSSAAHLSAQFKNVTGMSPTRFKQLKDRRIRPIDSI